VSASWFLLESAERFGRLARYTPLMKSTVIHLLSALVLSISSRLSPIFSCSSRLPRITRVLSRFRTAISGMDL
jgi:hypothetical protein